MKYSWSYYMFGPKFSKKVMKHPVTEDGTHVPFVGRGRVLPIRYCPHTLTGNVKIHTSMGSRELRAESAAETSV